MAVNVTKLSSKGQVVIPKLFRTAHQWESGQELVIVNVGDGVLLKTKTPFQETQIGDVASSLSYKGKGKTLDEMESAIALGFEAKYK